MSMFDAGSRNPQRDQFHRSAYRWPIAWALSGAIVMAPSIASAASATLLTSLICQDPRDVIDYHWASLKYAAAHLFFMKNDGTVVPLTAKNASFDSYDTVYVVAHGKVGAVGPFSSADFAKHFKAAHASVPHNAYFDSCFAAAANASASGSNLKIFDAVYGDKVKTLSGPVGACQLVGDGNPSLAHAVNKYDAKRSDQKAFDQIVKNIMTDWDSGKYAATGKSYQAACGDLMAKFDAAGVLDFVNAVFAHFTTAPLTPVATTINYLELIKLNTGGTDLLVCGADHKACP